MTDKTELTREEVEALLTGATPGPWGWIGTTPIALYSVPMQDVKHAILAPDDRCISRVNEQGQYVPLGSTSPDARLIAAAPTLARQLLATMDGRDRADYHLGRFVSQVAMALGLPATSAPEVVLRQARVTFDAAHQFAKENAQLRADLDRAADAALATMEPTDAD